MPKICQHLPHFSCSKRHIALAGHKPKAACRPLAVENLGSTWKIRSKIPRVWSILIEETCIDMHVYHVLKLDVEKWDLHPDTTDQKIQPLSKRSISSTALIPSFWGATGSSALNSWQRSREDSIRRLPPDVFVEALGLPQFLGASING